MAIRTGLAGAVVQRSLADWPVVLAAWLLVTDCWREVARSATLAGADRARQTGRRCLMTDESSRGSEYQATNA